MQNFGASNRDHNYSEVKSDKKSQNKSPNQSSESNTNVVTKNVKLVPLPSKDTVGGQIKDINELKKITPRVKLLPQDATSLNELTKLSLNTKTIPGTMQNKQSILEKTKQELKKYCRTCAGLKFPLVDIFSEKGMQMRLNQQMLHLKEIHSNDTLSTQMCMDCICDLKMSYKFFMQIKKAEVKLKSIHVTLSDTAAKNAESNNVQTSGSNQENSESKITIECDKKPTPVSTIKIEQSSPSETSTVITIRDIPTEEVKKINDNTNNNTVSSNRNNEKFCQEDKTGNHSDDNESIEEFDPEDPPFHPDSSDTAESDEEIDISQPRHGKKRNFLKKENDIKQCNLPIITKQINLPIATNNMTLQQNVQSNAKKELNQTVYKYDMALNAYVKVENPDSSKSGGYTDTPVLIKKLCVTNNDNTKDPVKAPNILKRRLLQPIQKKESTETSENRTADTNVTPKEAKIQKLDLQNPLTFNNSQEDGIMYVTVKGSKPNEILLVKVKKMGKPLEKKSDVKPIDKNIFKSPDMREQIIEEQIEEYKKKREKILGSGAKLDINQIRHVESLDDPKSEENALLMKEELVKVINDDIAIMKENNKNVEEEVVVIEEKKIESGTDKTKDCSSRVAKLRQKWEEARKQKESLQQEMDQSCTEGNVQRLERILGEKEQNLQDFQEYLKQRKIMIGRLKDEDIISLYENRNNALKKHLPDLIDESQPADYIPEENYLECDYCSATFASKEVLEEHLKVHDYKIMHYCEDCMEEFPTNKAKRNHNMMCIKKLICKYCDLLLDSKGKKRQHEQKHCDNMYGQLCDVCGEKFKHQGTLDQHIKTQHMSWEKIFQCSKCPKKFAFKQKLSFHLKSVHTTMRAYLCEDCGADFKNPASLRHHRIRKHQPVGNKRECPVCHKLVPFYSLSKHMHTHKAYTIQCPHCDKMFKNSSTLKQHVRIHEDQRQYRCDTCGVGFNRRDGLRLHMKVHEKTDSRGLKECSCQVCGEKFPNHSTLVIHRNRVHKDGRQYTCHICNRSMISTRSLEWHMSHIHNEALPGVVKEEAEGASEKRRVSCYHCSKTFKTEMILRAHIKNTHIAKDPVKCLDCELTFTSEVRLRHHMMIVHNRLEGTLPCPHCPKRFVNQLRLKTHMISHSEERPYTCEICGFNLKTKIQLIKHHQNRHSDERPLQCRYCPWRCKQVSALVCHERTHTNERPYSCSVCRQRFKYLGDKNKHERRHESLGGSGFKRIVPGRNIKQKIPEEDSTCSEQDHEEGKELEQLSGEQYEEQSNQNYEEDDQMIKFESQETEEEYQEACKQEEYEETSREASEAAEVIMNMEDTTVYTEEVTADNMETAEIMTNEIITSEILQSGTVVHLQQRDDSGKIQVIPVMLSLPDLSDTNAEVNLAAPIIYNN